MKRFASVVVAVAAAFLLAFAQFPSVVCSGQEEKPKDDPRLVAIGGLGASTLYLSFVLIGTTADAFGKDVYGVDEVKSIVESIDVLKVNTEQLEALRKIELTAEDSKYLNEIIEVMGMIREYAKLLGDYTKDKDPKVAEAFEEQRKKTWARLSKLLGIK